MRILLYEYFTGGGLWSEGLAPAAAPGFLVQGRAMARALSEDLSRVPRVELIRLRDGRLAEPVHPVGTDVAVHGSDDETRQLLAWSARVDAVLLIAPELNGRLTDRCRLIEQVPARLLSPSSTFVALTSDKTRTAMHLHAAGIPVPSSHALDAHVPPPPSFAYPAVWKPNDGAGSQATYLLANHTDALRYPLPDTASRLEQFCPGLSASVAALCGPRGPQLLPPCRQRLTEDGRFEYLGGSLPLPTPELVRRACRLARATLMALPPAIGYVGVDIVLGDSPEGDQDVVVEVNPRITTSYVGLRQAARSNLAAAMLDVAGGQPRPLFFHVGRVEFEADGRVVHDTLATLSS